MFDLATASPLLETKLYLPRRRRDVVPRARLSAHFNTGTSAKLTLVSAPAGFGKTTLIAEWLADSEHSAWLQLDHSDNDPKTFWTYVIAALRTVLPNVGSPALDLLQSSQPPHMEAILATLLNQLRGIRNDVVLVLDDYHVLDNAAIHTGMGFLVDHLPPSIHLVIATRADPPLPLARMRARGELVEVRAADLRFTPDEAAAYLDQVMGLHLTGSNVAALEERTEGWIAALQLAALSMRGRNDVADFIASFAGDDRYIVDYLVEEVLQRQPDRVRSFLLHTSILDRLSAALCDAVIGAESEKGMLESLERSNLFVVPLDNRRQWYRYHHLFADVLRARLVDERPDQVPDLHRRASAWYEHNAEPAEAIRHSLAARDFPKVAQLVERVLPALRRNRQEARLLSWLAALPDELLRCRPLLSNAYAGVLLTTGQLEGVEARLRDTERWLEDSANEMTDEEHRKLPGSVAVHRAGYALAVGNVGETVRHAQRALDLALEDDHLARGGAAGLLGLAAWGSGDVQTAHRSYASAMASLQRAGHIADALGCTIAVADLLIARGRLREAMRTYQQALQLAGQQGGPALRGTPDMYVGMSDLERERNDLATATQHLIKSQELGEHAGLPQNRYRSRVAMARVQLAQGDPDGAVDLLEEAERVYAGDLFPNVRPIAALKARVWIAQGKLHEAGAWARDRGLSPDDELTYLREFEHITLARLLLARGPIMEALALLERLLRDADTGARTGSVVEILVLQAVGHHSQGDLAAALVPLERALSLAEPEDYVRMFVDEGPPMAALLAAAAKRRIQSGYAHHLLAALGQPADRPSATNGLIEPLSERELDVLRLLGTDLDGPDIARELVVSLNTVRTHTKNIYSKLGVTNRRAAVRRAAELALL